MTQLSDAVIFVARGAPSLMLGDQAILHVVFVGKRPVSVVDIHQTAQGIVAVVYFFAIGEGFHQQSTGSIALILGNQFAAVIAEFGFLQQLAVEVVFVCGAAAVETGFLLDQAVRVVVEFVMLATFVFDFSEQQTRVVVAIE